MDIQTHLVKTLKRDILIQRRMIQHTLSTRLLYDVKKHRIVDEHFDSKRRALLRAADASKHHLDARMDYYTGRGHVALDMLYSELFAKLDRLETTVMGDLEALKAHNDTILKELADLEHTMAIRQSTCHFFKGLYETHPARPVGETRDMLCADDSVERSTRESNDGDE